MRRMLLALSLCWLLLTGSTIVHAQVAHAVGTVDGTPTSTIVLTGATTANALLVITDKVDGVTDSDGHTFVKQNDQQGYNTWTQIWTAYGVTISSSDTITVSGNYNGTKPLALAFANIASADKYQSFGNTNTSDNPIKAGPITPTNPNEVVVGITAGTFNTTPTWDASTSTPAGWSQVEADPSTGTSFAAYVLTEGSGTPAAATFSVHDNSFNGHMTAILSLAATASPLPLTVTPSTLPHGMRTAAYPATASNLNGPFAQSCITPSGGAAPYTVTMTGSVPGLSLGAAPDYCLTGTPTTTGTYTVSFHVVDHLGATADTPSMSLVIEQLLTTVDLGGPRYGFTVFPGAVRHPGAVETNPGATGKINWSISDSSKGTLSCTTNCVGTVTVTATGTAGTCTVAGSVGNYSIAGGNDFTVTATSADTNEDGSHSSDSEVYHICKGDHLVDLQPAYNQAFFGQQKHIYSYVMGQISQNGTWSCVAPDSSSCDAALDVDLPSGSGAGTKRHNRDVTFTAPSTVGSYKLIFTSPSDYDGTTASNYGWIYVGGALTTAHTGTTALPVSPDGTEVQACFPDPRFTTTWAVKKDGTGDFIHPWQASTDQAADQNSGGYLMRVFNQDGTGSAPTQYPDFWYITRGGTRDLPVVVCGVPDASGHLPIIQRQSATSSGRDEGAYGTGFAGNIITIAPRIGAPTGYDTSSNTDFVNVWALNFIDSSHASDARAVLVGPGGRHIAMEGIHTDYMMDGALWNNDTNYSGTHSSVFSSVIGSYFQRCGHFGDTGNHCLYLEGMYTLIAGNKFQDTIDGAGLANKIRGGGSIVAFNSYVGEFGYPEIDYEAMTDDAPYTSVEINLGAIGDSNCDNSIYCNIMASGGDENWLHIADNEQALATAYSYGNIFSNTVGNAYAVIAYGVMNYNACNAPGDSCTTGIDHVGGFHFWNNTLDREGGAQIGSEGVFFNSNYDGSKMRTWPWIWEQNNSMWNAGTSPDGSTPPPFQLYQSPYGMGGFKNNLIAAGSVDLSSPIVAGHTGWPTETRTRPPWTDYQTKDSYVTGLDTFVVTPTIPYDTTTFQPLTNSPLNGAGAPIVDPLMAVLPLRYESDPVGGFVVPRTDNGATIGARASTAPVTVAGTPSFTPNAGTYTAAQSVTIATSTSGATICYTSDGSTPTGDGAGTCTHGSTYSSAVSVAASETLKAIASKSGLTDSSVANAAYVINITTPTAATPTCSPAAGTYTSAQTVSCSSTTPSSTTYCTVDGTTPTTSSPVCTSIAVAASLTLKAISAASGDSNSAVLTQVYTITTASPAATPTFSPVAGTYTSAQSVTISSTTSGATICYTTDGTTPTANGSGTCTHGSTYSAAVSVAASKTLKAVASKSGNTDSSVGSAAYTINIPSTLTVTTTSLPSGTVNSTYPSTQLGATGGTGPYTWVQISGATFPPGLTVVSDGTISGIPTAAGTYSGLTFRVTDSVGATADSVSLTITINPAAAVGGPRLGNVILRYGVIR